MLIVAHLGKMFSKRMFPTFVSKQVSRVNQLFGPIYTWVVTIFDTPVRSDLASIGYKWLVRCPEPVRSPVMEEDYTNIDKEKAAKEHEKQSEPTFAKRTLTEKVKNILKNLPLKHRTGRWKARLISGNFVPFSVTF